MEGRLLLGAIRRNVPLIVALALIGAVVGGWLGYSSKLTYQATSTVSVAQPDLSPLAGGQTQLDPVQYVSTQVGVIGSSSVFGPVGRQLGMSEADVAKMVSVAQRQTSDLIDITATAGDSSQAARVANLVATTYVDQLTSRVESLVSSAVATLQSQRIHLEAQLQASTSPASASAIEAQLGPIDQTLTQIQAASNASLANTEIVDTATPPAYPMPRHTSLKAGLGLAGGLVIGIIAAVLIAALRPRMMRGSDVEDVTGLSASAQLPFVPAWAGGGSDGPSVSVDWRGQPEFAIEIAKMAVFVEAARSRRNCKTVVVTSIERGAGVSTVADALASVLRENARDVRRVHLTSLDRSQPRSSVEFLDHPDEVWAIEQRAWVSSLVTRALGVAEEEPAGGSHLPVLALNDDDYDADITVVDGGSMIENSSVVPLARSSDVTVLVVPLPNENERYLHALTSATFAEARGQLLIVTNNLTGPRPRRSGSRG